MNGELLDNLDLFLQWFAASITDALNLQDKLEEYWKGVLSSKNKCTNYFQRYLLASIDTPVALGLDEVDEVFRHPAITSDFFALLRAWHERAKNDPVWKKLRVVLVYSQQVYVPLNINQSPFNVGLRIELPELNQAQVQDLVKRHRLNWTREQVEQLMILVGGHPYLVRVALYQIARGRMTLEKLQQVAPTDEGLYSDHLRRNLLNLQENAELLVAFTKVISANNPLQIGTAEAFKLRCIGLIKLQGDFAMPSCELYRQYFGDRLAFNSVHEEAAQVQSPRLKKILILSANPMNTNKLGLDEEVREIEAGLERSRSRDRFQIISKWAVRSNDLRRALLDHKPEIVHFSGHGAGSQGLALENNSGQMQLVKTKTLAGLFELFDSIECVLLNACYSEAQAQAIYQHVDCVIGMNRAIGDRAAIEFAVGFYDALGADRSYEDAYKFGCLNIDLEGIPESSTPVLKARKSHNRVNSINVSVQSPRLRKILILSANPKQTSRLRLDEEVREIEAGLKRSRSREQFEIISKWAVRPNDLRRALLDHQPEIVHFSGHGAGSQGLALENNSGQMQLVKSKELAGIFELFDSIECVLLNACYDEVQAEAIYQHVDYVIGMNGAIGDRPAIEFAVGFYDALGADRSYEDAYKFGCLNIDLEGIPESSTPVLKKRNPQNKANLINTLE
jgi:hypothetical protein